MYKHHADPERIEASMEALSRELRWHRRAWLGLVLAGGAVALAGAAKLPAGQELRTTKIVLTDAAGAVRGTLGVEADGTPALRLFDAAGVERLAALVSGTGPSVRFSIRTGRLPRSSWSRAASHALPFRTGRGPTASGWPFVSALRPSSSSRPTAWRAVASPP